MKRREFTCVLGRIASGFWSRRGIIIVVSTAMVLMPIKVSHAGWLSDLFKGSQSKANRQDKASRQSKPRHTSQPLRRNTLPRQSATP